MIDEAIEEYKQDVMHNCGLYGLTGKMSRTNRSKLKEAITKEIEKAFKAARKTWKDSPILKYKDWQQYKQDNKI